MALARHAADAGTPLSRRPPGADREQPDLHLGHLAGAAGDRDAGAVLGLSDVLDAAGDAAALLRRQPRSRHHRPARARRHHPVLEPGQPARRGRPGRADGQRDRPDADHGPRPERDLAGAQAAADRTARAHLLGGDDARAAAARCQRGRHLVRAVGLARLPGRRAARPRPACSASANSSSFRSAWPRSSTTCRIPTCAGAMR